MSSSINAEFYQTAQDSLRILTEDMNAHIDGRRVNGFGYIVNLVDGDDSNAALNMRSAIRMLYPFHNRLHPRNYSREAQAAISGITLALHMIRGARSYHYDAVTDQMSEQLHPTTGLPGQPNGAERFEAIGTNVLNQLGIHPETDIPFYSEIAWDVEHRPQFDGAFGFTIGAFAEVSAADIGELQAEADALVNMDQLSTGDIGWYTPKIY